MTVLSKSHATVPEREIKDIRPLITMVGGKVVYDAMLR
jgi:predicted amidohydrolase YtcJ